MNKFGLVCLLALFSLTAGGALVQAAPPEGGVPQQLGAVADELQGIADQLSALPLGAGIEGAASAEGLIVDPPANTTHVLVNLTGPGTFIAARMTKQGGASGLTAVSLEIDGRTVVNRNIIALKNLGMTQSNPFGVVVLTGAVDAVTIGFPQPLVFHNSLTLKAVVGEPGVVQIIGTVIYGD